VKLDDQNDQLTIRQTKTDLSTVLQKETQTEVQTQTQTATVENVSTEVGRAIGSISRVLLVLVRVGHPWVVELCYSIGRICAVCERARLRCLNNIVYGLPDPNRHGVFEMGRERSRPNVLLECGCFLQADSFHCR
jgi:hypothetical protein